MSRIFDALRKSEIDNSETGLSATPAAADLLQVVEHQSRSAWAAATVISDRANKEPESVVEEQEINKPFAYHGREETLSQLQSLHISVTPESQLVCVTDKESLIAEKFRFLGVRLRHLRRERALKKILITSTVPHEGKSTVAANLACTLARKKEQKVLLLEGDLRRPGLSQMLGLKKHPGICEWLESEQKSLTNIYRLEGLDLWCFPAGAASTNPLELLQSTRLPALMDRLSKLFDWIVIDSSPILPLADTSVWARMADGILLVARPGVTEKALLQSGLEAIDQHKLIGTLLNSSQSPAHSEYYYSYASSAANNAENVK